MATVDSKTSEANLQDLQQDKLIKDDVLFELEQKQLALETENSELKTEVAKALTREKAAGDQVKFLTGEHEKVKQILHERTAKLSDLELRFATLETTKVRLEEQLREHIEDADRNRREAEKQAEKVVSLSLEISKHEDSNSTLHAENLRLKYTCEQVTREKELLQKHQQWLDAEVTLRTNELRDLREQKANQVLGLERELSQLQEQTSVLEVQIESVRQESAAKTLQVTEHLKTIRLLEVNHATALEQVKVELDKQNKLVELYKKRNEQEREKTTDVYKSAEQIARDLAHEKQKMEAAVSEMQKLEISLEEATRERDRLAAELQNEREKSKTFLLSNDDDSVRSVYSSSPPEEPPLDASVPQWSYMELFAKYQVAVEEARKCKREYRDMEAHVKQIKLESDDKSPLLDSQRFQYNRILQAHKQVTARFNEAKRALEQSEEKYDAAQKELQDLDKERGILRNENSDLSRQVISLLKSSGHGASSLAVLATERSRNALIAQNDIISDTLVEVSSVEDMQEQNRKQLAVIRQFDKQFNELSAEKEKWVTEQTQKRSETEGLKKALDALKAEREQQELRLEALQQSLKLNQALEDDEGSLVDDMDDDASVTSVGKRRRLGAYQKSIQSALEAKNSELIRQLAEANEKDVAFRKSQRESLVEMQTTIDQLRMEASKCRAELAQATAEAKWQKETHQAYVQNTQTLEKERAREKEKCASLMASLAEHQTRLSNANIELQSLRQQFEKATVDLANARAELEISKKGEARLLMENEKLMLDVRRQETVLGHLRDLQTALKAQDQGAVKRLTTEKEELRVECKNLKNELDAERRDKRDLLKTSGAKTEQLQAKLDHVEPLYQEAQRELATLQSRADEATKRYAEAQKALDIQREQVEILLKMKGGATLDLTNPKLAHLGEDNQLQKTLTETLAENARLTETLAQAQEQNAVLKSFGEKTERDLKQLTQSSKDYHSKTEETIAKLTSENQALLKRAEELDTKIRQFEGDEGKIREDLEKRVAQLSALVELANEEKRQNEAGVAQWQQQRAKLLDDIKLHAELASKAQNEREQEVLAHAADVSRLSQLKNEFELLQKRVEAAEHEALSARTQLQTSEDSWTRQKSEFETQIQRLEAKLDETSKHAEVLLSQLESVTLQSKRLGEQALAQGSDSGAPQDNEEVAKLNKILSYIRTERDVAVAEKEQAQQELLKAQFSVQRLEGVLKDERAQREQVTKMDTAKELAKQSHAKVMEQLTQLNLFKESNTFLRDEQSQYQQKIKELEQKLKELESKMSPLQATVRTLEAAREALQADCRSLETECTRWKQRNQQLLDKYQTVDMDEYKRMTTEYNKMIEAQKTTAENHQKALTESKTEIDRLKGVQTALTIRNNSLSAQVQQKDAALKKQAEAPPPSAAPSPTTATNLAHANKQSAMLNAARLALNARMAELETARKGLETAKAEATAAKAELETLKTAHATMKTQLDQVQAERAKLQLAAKSFEGERAAHVKTAQALAALEAERENAQKSDTTAEVQIEKERLQRELDAKMDVHKSMLQKAQSDLSLSDAKVNALQGQVKELKQLSINAQAEAQKHSKAERLAIQVQLEAKTNLADKTKELEKAQSELRQGEAENTDLRQTNLSLQHQLESLSSQLQKLQAALDARSPVTKPPTPTPSESLSTLESTSAFPSVVPPPSSVTTSPQPVQAAKRKQAPVSTPPVAKKTTATTSALKPETPAGPVSAFPSTNPLKRPHEETTPVASMLSAFPPATSVFPPMPATTTSTLQTVSESVSIFGSLSASSVSSVFASPVMQSQFQTVPLADIEPALLPGPAMLTSAFGQSLLSSTTTVPPALPVPMLATAFSAPPVGVVPLFGVSKIEEHKLTSFTQVPPQVEDVSEDKTDSLAEKEGEDSKEGQEGSREGGEELPAEEEDQLELSMEGEEEPEAPLKGGDEEPLPVIESTTNMEDEDNLEDDGEGHEEAAEPTEGENVDQELHEHQGEPEGHEESSGSNDEDVSQQDEQSQQEESMVSQAETPTEQRHGAGESEESNIYSEQDASVEERIVEPVTIEEESSTSNSQELRGHSSSSELLTSVDQESSTNSSEEQRGHSAGGSSEMESVNDEEHVDVNDDGNNGRIYGGEEPEHVDFHIEPGINPADIQANKEAEGSEDIL